MNTKFLKYVGMLLSISPLFISYVNSDFDYTMALFQAYHCSVEQPKRKKCNGFRLADHAASPPVLLFLDNFCSGTP